MGSKGPRDLSGRGPDRLGVFPAGIAAVDVRCDRRLVGRREGTVDPGDNPIGKLRIPATHRSVISLPILSARGPLTRILSQGRPSLFPPLMARPPS
jgi:hypothetical protein